MIFKEETSRPIVCKQDEIVLSSILIDSFWSGGPLVITRPHMLDTATAYKTVIGLHPDAEKHGIYAEFEPVCVFCSSNCSDLLSCSLGFL